MAAPPRAGALSSGYPTKGNPVTDERFAQVDQHLAALFGSPDPVLTGAAERAEAAGLPSIAVSSGIGRLLHVLALACGARRILEIGTLGGYSAIWLARALPPDGRVVSLELDPHHAAVARESLAAAAVDDRVEVRVGPALDSLAAMAGEGVEPFDLVFIDADKPPYAEYLEAAVGLSRPGALIVADNVVRAGAIADGPSDDPAVAGVQRFNAVVAADPRLAAAILQVVGVKGHDGLAFAVVLDG